MRERRLQPFGAARRAVYTLRSPKDDLQTVLAKYCTIKGLFRRDGMLKHPLMDRASLQHDVRFSIFFVRDMVLSAACIAASDRGTP